MNIIADAIGTNYTLQALEYQQNGDFQSAGFYFSQGIEKYQDALQSNPNNPSLLEHLAISQAGEVIVSTILKSGEVPKDTFIFNIFCFSDSICVETEGHLGTLAKCPFGTKGRQSDRMRSDIFTRP
jgi:hypothetical protein